MGSSSIIEQQIWYSDKVINASLVSKGHYIANLLRKDLCRWRKVYEK